MALGSHRGAHGRFLLSGNGMREIDEGMRRCDLVPVPVPRNADGPSTHAGDLEYSDARSVWIDRKPREEGGTDAFFSEAQDDAVVVGAEDDLLLQRGATEPVLDPSCLPNLRVGDQRELRQSP